jgi:hypothetical protein
MERELLLQVVEDARRRLASRHAWWWGGRVALGWGGCVLLLVLARAIVPLEIPYVTVAVAGFAASLMVVVALRIAVRPSPLVAAQILDQRFACADLLATAVEVVTGRHRPTALTHAVVDDAVGRAADLDLKRRLRAGPERTMAAGAALVAAAILLAGVLTGLSLPGTPARDLTRTIQREGRRIERAGQTMEEQARAERARISRRMAPAIQRLGEVLQRQRMERSDALARLESLGRQLDAERRQVQSRREQLSGAPQPRPSPTLPSDLFRQRASVDRAIRQIREIADRLAQSKSPEEREALMRQLASLAGGGEEGNVPARARQQAETARQQAAAGDTSAARQTLQQSAADLDDLRAMLADEEGLQQAQRDLRRSADQIASGVPGAPVESEQAPQAGAKPGSARPGDRPPNEGVGPETEAPPGPNQGTTPGQGTIAEKLGARTPRLEAERHQTRVRGLQGEGRTTMSELLGPGRTARVRATAGPAAATLRGDADRYMARMRIPPEYREIVRRYFETLAASR